MNGAAEMNEAGGWRWREVALGGVAGGAGKRRGSARDYPPLRARAQRRCGSAEGDTTRRMVRIVD